MHDGDPYHIKTSPLICSANQWIGFPKIATFVMNELIHVKICCLEQLKSVGLGHYFEFFNLAAVAKLMYCYK